MTAHAIASGGAGGSAHSTSFANGVGGSATATATTNGPIYHTITAEAYGGAGGAKYNGNPAAGGSATANLLDNQYSVQQFSPAVGNAGGSAYVQITSGGGIFNNVLNVGSSTGITNNTALSASGNGIVTMNGLLGSGSLSISGNADFQLAAYSGASQQSSLSVTAGGTFDITNNHFFLNYGSGSDPIASIAAYIRKGYMNGTWNGTGITSSVAQENSAHYGIGFADSADHGNPAHLCLKRSDRN